MNWPAILETLRNVVRRAVVWIGGFDLIVLIAVLTATLSLLAFIQIADEVTDGDTRKFDERILLSLRNPADLNDPLGPKWFEEAARDLTSLGGITALLLMTIAVVGYLLISRVYSAMWLVLASSLGGLLISTLLKQLFDRPRPSIVPHLAHVSTASFPSGHSMLSAVVYLTLGALLARLMPSLSQRVYVLAAALTLTFLIGISRVYLGVHYPTDVVAGWSIGLVWSILCWTVARALQRRGKVEQTVQ